jgi:ribosomal protein L24E
MNSISSFRFSSSKATKMMAKKEQPTRYTNQQHIDERKVSLEEIQDIEECFGR